MESMTHTMVDIVYGIGYKVYIYALNYTDM